MKKAAVTCILLMLLFTAAAVFAETGGEFENPAYSPEFAAQQERMLADVEQTFAHAEQRMLGTVHAFGEEVKVHVIVNHIDSLVERVVVLAHGGHPVANAEDGQNAQKVQYLGNDWILEDVTPSDEHLFHIVR